MTLVLIDSENQTFIQTERAKLMQLLINKRVCGIPDSCFKHKFNFGGIYGLNNKIFVEYIKIVFIIVIFGIQIYIYI